MKTETKQTYNGWTNYETWNVKLWMDNEQGTQEYWEEAAQEALDATDEDEDDRKREAVYTLSERLKDEHEEAAEEWKGKAVCTFSDLLGAALSEVNWYEIAESLLDDKTPSE